MATEKRYCLVDKDPICMECNKPFKQHTEKDAEQCIKKWEDRSGDYGNLVYLKEGLKQVGL